MLDSERIRVVNATDKIRDPFVFGKYLRLLPIYNERNGCRSGRSKNSRDSTLEGFQWESMQQNIILLASHTVSTGLKANGSLHAPGGMNGNRMCRSFAAVSWIQPISKCCSELLSSGGGHCFLNSVDLYPCTFVSSELFNARLESAGSSIGSAFGRVGRLFGFAPLESGKSGVGQNDEKTEYFNFRFWLPEEFFKALGALLCGIGILSGASYGWILLGRIGRDSLRDFVTRTFLIACAQGLLSICNLLGWWRSPRELMPWQRYFIAKMPYSMCQA